MAWLVLLAACRGESPAARANDAAPSQELPPANDAAPSAGETANDAAAPVTSDAGPRATAAPLGGPYRSERKLWKACSPLVTLDKNSEIIVLGEKKLPGGISVSLRQYMAQPSSADCAVTIQTDKGLYAGPFFMCYFGRSDEDGETKDVTVDISGTTATIRFTTTFLSGDFMMDEPASRNKPHEITRHEITCSLEGERPSCTPPPSVGGYDPEGPCKRP